MSEQSLTVGPGTRVTLHFTLRLAGGDEVDSTRGGDAARFDVGDGSLPPGFEESLFGLAAGDERALEIPPEKGFGMPNPDNVQRRRREEFPPDLELEEGLVLAFADAGQAETPGVVREVGAEEVVVDFNHPLAGRPLVFDVRIVEVEPAQTH